MVLYFILFVFNLKINVIDDYNIRKIKKQIFVKKIIIQVLTLVISTIIKFNSKTKVMVNNATNINKMNNLLSS
jgi:hypothetical protein